MVTFQPRGRFGNVLFQYVSARLFADRFDLCMASEWPMPDWLWRKGAEFCVERGLEVHGNVTVINDQNFLEWMVMDAVAPRHFHFDGYFQYGPLIERARDVVLNMFDWKPVDPIGPDSICLYCRLTDHGHGRLHLSPQWYVDVLEREPGVKNVTVVTDDRFAGNDYFGALRKWRPKIVSSPNALDDFNLIRAHEKIAIGPSSFGWWAAFTGRAKRIYQWKRDQELPYIQYQMGSIIRGSLYEREVIPVDGKFLREA